MKIAKASKQDMDAAAELVALLNTVDDGYYPSASGEDDAGEAPMFFDEDDPEHLRLFYSKVMGLVEKSPGGMLRVVYGFSAVLAPENEIVDPEDQALSFHPRFDAEMKDAERYRWLRSRPLDDDDGDGIHISAGDAVPGRWALGGDDPDGCDAAIDAAMEEKP